MRRGNRRLAGGGSFCGAALYRCPRAARGSRLETTGGFIEGSGPGAAYAVVVDNTGVPGATYAIAIGSVANPFLIADDAILFQDDLVTPGYSYTYIGTTLTVFQGETVLYIMTDFNSSDLPATAIPVLFTTVTPINPVTYLGTSYYILGQISATCFTKGTHILTPAGETKVENLKVGDLVITFNNSIREPMPIKWIGRSGLNSRTMNSTHSPIRIKKNAFAENKPHTDLLVSPLHSLYVDGVLVAAKLLINNRSIYQDHSFKFDSYYHIELENHSILFAEGLETESFLDTGYKHLFVGEKKADPSTFKAWEKDGYASVIYNEQDAEAIKNKLSDRAKILGYGLHINKQNVMII